jgi:hypothetical protein
MADKIEVKMKLSQEFVAALEVLGGFTGEIDKAELIRHALQVYEYVARRTAEGCEFELRGIDGRLRKVLFFQGNIREIE